MRDLTVVSAIGIAIAASIYLISILRLRFLTIYDNTISRVNYIIDLYSLNRIIIKKDTTPIHKMSERFLTDLIRRKRYTVKEVAKTIGVAVSTIYDWNENAPIVQLYEISKCIGVPFYEIVDCYDPESPPPVILPTDRN